MYCCLARAEESSCGLNSQQGESELTEFSAGETRLAWYLSELVGSYSRISAVSALQFCSVDVPL